jgi:DNA-binding PadR family transcriptional regulator
MHLEHAILGFLNYVPFTGYDLKRSFESSVRHFWPADQSQIYKTLRRLAEQGFVTHEVVQQEGRPNRKVYRITEAGRKELRAWIGRTPDPEEVRSPFLIQVFFAGLLNDDEIIAMLEAKAQQLRELLDRYRSIADAPLEDEGQEAPPRERFFWYLTLDNGLSNKQAELDWIEDAMERIRNKEYEQGGRVLPPPRRTR